MVRIDTYPHGEVRYCDCMDEEYGLPCLEDGSFELGFTDYPFNVDFKGKCYGGKTYTDNLEFDQYLDFCKTTFKQLERVSKGQLIFCGNPNLNMWIKYIKEPIDIAIHYKPNCQSRGKGYYCPKHDSILIYNKVKIGKSVYEYNTEYQPLNKHPCPNNPKLYSALIIDSGVNSVIDPFLGSGTTAEVCEKLGIKWLGYEIKEEYSQDIEKRLKNVKVEPKQSSLEVFTE